MNTNMPDARTHLFRALEADLIGPCTLDPAAVETLPLAPTRWYLTGFLAPQHAQPQGAELEEEELDGEALERGREIAPGLWLEGRLAGASAPGLPPGTRALSVFVVNRRRVDAVRPFDESCIFQVGLELQHPAGLVARPNRRDERS